MIKNLCVNFSMLAAPFKPTGVGGGHQAAVYQLFGQNGMEKKFYNVGHL